MWTQANFNFMWNDRIEKKQKINQMQQKMRKP